MLYIINKEDLTDEEVEKIRNSDLDYAFVGTDDTVNLNKSNPIRYIYVSKKVENVRIPYNNGFVTPTVIKIDSNEFWTDDDGLVDAKVKSIDDLINEEFITLLGEKVCFSGIKNISLCSYFYTKKHICYTKDKKIAINTVESYAMGRYFPKEKAKSNLDVYSAKILKCKKGGKTEKIFYKFLIDKFLERNNLNYDYCWYVPVKSNQLNRFELINSANGIVLLEDYGSIKKLTLSERYEVVKNKFALNKTYNINDKVIVLIDDIITTGATLETITKILYLNGARKVIWITFAKTISNESIINLNYICNKCKSSLCVRFRNDDGKKLYVCPKCNEFYNCSFPNLNRIFKNY